MTQQIGNTDLIDTWASDGNIVDPDTSKKEEGWLLGEQPPHEWMNHIQNEHGQKINRLLRDNYSSDSAFSQRVIYVGSESDLQALDTSEFSAGQQASVAESGVFIWSGSEWRPKGAETITVRVPSDYPDWQEAFDAVASLPHNGGIGGAEILIESGHVLQSGLYVGAGDYSHITISSEDSEVPVSSSFEGVSSNAPAPGAGVERCMIVDYGKSPFIRIRVNGDNWRPSTSDPDRLFGQRGGFAVFKGGVAVFDGTVDAGFVNFTGQNAYCREAQIIARSCDFYGAGTAGIQVTGGSTFEISDSDFQDCWWNIADLESDVDIFGSASVSISRGSSGNAQGINASNSGRYGMDSRRSFVNYSGAIARDCYFSGLAVRSGGYIVAMGVDVGESGTIEINTSNGGGIINLGRDSVYDRLVTLRNSGFFFENTNHRAGIVYNADLLSMPSFEEDESSQWYVFENGLMEKIFEVEVDTSTTSAQLFSSPGRNFLEDTIKVVSISCADVVSNQQRDDFSLLTAGMSSGAVSTFNLRMEEEGSGSPLTVQVKISGRAFEMRQ